jgi:hypothetical protein
MKRQQEKIFVSSGSDPESETDSDYNPNERKKRKKRKKKGQRTGRKPQTGAPSKYDPQPETGVPPEDDAQPQTGAPPEDDAQPQTGAPPEDDPESEPEAPSATKLSVLRQERSRDNTGQKELHKAVLQSIDAANRITSEAVIKLCAELEHKNHELSCANAHLQAMTKLVAEGKIDNEMWQRLAASKDKCAIQLQQSVDELKVMIAYAESRAVQAESQAAQAESRAKILMNSIHGLRNNIEQFEHALEEAESENKRLKAERTAHLQNFQLVECCGQCSNQCDFGDVKINSRHAMCCGQDTEHKHYLCAGCVEALIIDQLKPANVEQIIEDKGCFKCPLPNCGRMFTDAEMFELGPETFSEYLKLQKKYTEIRCNLQADEQKQIELDALRERLCRMSPLDSNIDLLEKQLEEIFSTCCPACGALFLGYTGCMALKCGMCIHFFCAWCLDVYGTSDEMHTHIAHCPMRPQGQIGEHYADAGNIPMQKKILIQQRLLKKKEQCMLDIDGPTVWYKALLLVRDLFDQHELIVFYDKLLKECTPAE